MTNQNITFTPVIYTESTPNPATLKFVANKGILPQKHIEINSIEETEISPFGKELFQVEGIVRIFISQNFVTVTKKDDFQWIELIPQVKGIMKSYFEEGKEFFSQEFLSTLEEESKKSAEGSVSGGSEMEEKIVAALDKYVKPAVEGDGGAISFVSFENGKLTVSLEGSCNGCPSSTVTLKNGIENLMQKIIPEVQEVVALS